MAQSVFGTARCRRLPYALILLAILAFDFLKAPLQAYIAKVYNSQTQAVISELQQLTDLAQPMQGQELRPGMDARQFSQDHLGGLRGTNLANKANIPTSGPNSGPSSEIVLPDNFDKTAFRQSHSQQSNTPLRVDENFLQKTEAFSTKMTAIESTYVIALGLVGLASLVALAWAVLARMRDIGWPAWVGISVLGVYLLKMWTMNAVPLAVTAFLHFGFFALLLALAFVPSDFDGRWKLVSEPEPDPGVKILPSRGQTQFGRRTY